MEVWLGPALGFDVANGRAQIYGSGHNKTSWISFAGRRAVRRVRRGSSARPGRDPQAWRPRRAEPPGSGGAGGAAVGSKNGSPACARRRASGAAQAAATDSMQKSFAGLMLYYARGDVIEMTEAVKMLPVPSLTSVRDYLRASLQARPRFETSWNLDSFGPWLNSRFASTTARPTSATWGSGASSPASLPRLARSARAALARRRLR